MANSSAKKRAQENQAAMALLTKLVLAINGYYVLVRIVWQWSSMGIAHMMGAGLLLAANALAFVALNAVAKPEYSEGGELLDGGGDVHAGINEYYWDVLYITWFVQVTTTYSSYFWLVYLVIPGFGLWRLWFDLVKPWIFDEGMFAKVFPPPSLFPKRTPTHNRTNGQPQAEDEDEKSRKRREKKERRMQMPRFKTSRR